MRDWISAGWSRRNLELLVWKCAKAPDLAVVSQLKGVEGCMLVDTCERCEVWMWAKQSAGLEKAMERLAEGCEEVPGAALEHIVRVTAGLESTLKGEYAIVGQVREAMHRAEAEGYMCAGLRKCLDEAFLEQKKLRKNGAKTEEIEDIAVRIAKGSVVAVFGTGMVGKRLVERLKRKDGIRKIYWAYHVNRLPDADERIETLPMKECLQIVNRCVCSSDLVKCDEPLRMETDGLVIDFGEKACVVCAGENYIPLAEMQRMARR